MKDDPSRGHVVDIGDKPASRREVTVTTSLTGITRVTLMPGLLGTPDGDAVLDLASDLHGIYLGNVRRNRPRPKRAAPG